METSKCFMFRKLCACLYAFRNIGKSNPISIVDQIICPLGHFTLMIFVVGRTFLRWTYNIMKFPVHLEPETADFYSFFVCVFVVGARARLLHIYVFSSLFLIVPLQVNVIFLWSSPPPLFNRFFYTRDLLFCDPPIGSHNIASFLFPNIVLLHVSNMCRLFASYPWYHQ